MRLSALALILLLIASLSVTAQTDQPADNELSARAVNLIRFSGTVPNTSRPGDVVGVTFSIYADAEGAELLWSETQNVRSDRQGRYTVLLGAESGGVPPELFAGESARWLGARTADGRESKTLLVSVPYALKAAFAGNAETLAGQPAANFVTRQELSSSQIVLASGAVVPLATSGTPSRIGKFTSSTELGDSSITEFFGTAACTLASPCIGIGVAAPERTLHVRGNSGAMVFDAGNLATNPVLFFTHDNLIGLPGSKFRNRVMLDRTNESMQIWSQNGPRLFVVGDRVGINTATPAYALDVAGPMRVAGGIVFADGTAFTSAAAPGSLGDISSVTAGAGLAGGGTGGDVNLSVIFAGPGAANSVARSDHNHEKAGMFNTGVGKNALASVTYDYSTGQGASVNTAIGDSALQYNSTGQANTAVGSLTLYLNETGNHNTGLGYGVLTQSKSGYNTAVGSGALTGTTTGGSNTAVGASALIFNKSGSSNTAVGLNALQYVNGDNNIALGAYAGWRPTAGSFNIFIGSSGPDGTVSNRIFIGQPGAHHGITIAGIRGTTINSNEAVAVLIDSAGQLGTVSSSARVKFDIAPMAAASRRVLELRPVTFRYQQPYADGSQPIQFGLIAEEVAATFPELAARNAAGEIETVKYHLLPVLLLNEVQRQQAELDAKDKKIAELEERLARIEAALADQP